MARRARDHALAVDRVLRPDGAGTIDFRQCHERKADCAAPLFAFGWPERADHDAPSKRAVGADEDERLRALMEAGKTARAISADFRRTTRAIRRRAERLKLSWRKAKAQMRGG